MTTQGAKITVALTLLAVFILLVLIGPIFTIWALNTLFGLEIPLTFKTWAAVVWLTTVLHGIKISLKKDN